VCLYRGHGHILADLDGPRFQAFREESPKELARSPMHRSFRPVEAREHEGHRGDELMSRSHLATILLTSLAMTPQQPIIAADDPPDEPKRIFKDDFIENLVGDWKLTRRIRGTEVHNTVKAGWVLNHQFLQLHMKDVANPRTYEALVLIGYSYTDKQYIAHWCDTFGGKFSARGFGKRSGDSIEFQFQYPDGPFFNSLPGTRKRRGGRAGWRRKARTASGRCSPRTRCGGRRNDAERPMSSGAGSVASGSPWPVAGVGLGSRG
jgi:hypothetical protein